MMQLHGEEGQDLVDPREWLWWLEEAWKGEMMMMIAGCPWHHWGPWHEAHHQECLLHGEPCLAGKHMSDGGDLQAVC